MTGAKTAHLFVVGLLLLAFAGQAYARPSSEGQSSNTELWNEAKISIQRNTGCSIWLSMLDDIFNSGVVPNLRESMRGREFARCFPGIVAKLGLPAEAAPAAKKAAEKRVASVERDVKSLGRVGTVRKMVPGQFPAGVNEEYLIKAREAITSNNIRSDKCRRISPDQLREFAMGYLDAILPGKGSLRDLYLYCYPELFGIVVGGGIEVDARTTSGSNVGTVKRTITAETSVGAARFGLCKNEPWRTIQYYCRTGMGSPKLAPCC